MNWKKITPVFIAILVFAVITVILFRPMFQGKVINQSDIVQFRGMSKEISDFRNLEHAEPLWTNSMFGGMPAYQVSTLYSGNWMNKLDTLFHLFLPQQSGYVFMYFLGFFILLLCLEINPWLALTGALAYGFSSYFFIILEVGHNSKANAIGYLAPLLGGIMLLLRGRYWFGFALTTLFMALELNANHIQITYYGMMIFLAVFISYFIMAVRTHTLKPYFLAVGIFASASLLAILPNAGSLLCTYEYGDYTTRGKSELTMDAGLKTNKGNKTSGLDKDYATQWSYGIDETFTFLIPDFKGGGSVPLSYADPKAVDDVDPQLKEQIGGESAYFGDQGYTSGPVYIGSIIIMLCVFSLFYIRHPLKWALVGVTIITVMLSWGHNLMGFTSFFMDHFPGYNKFRSVTIILIVAELTLPLLAMLGLNKLIADKQQEAPLKIPFTAYTITPLKALYASLILAGGFCALAYVMPQTVNTFSPDTEKYQLLSQFKQGGLSTAQSNALLPSFTDNLEKARIALFRADTLRSLCFILLTGILLYLYLKNKIRAGVLIPVIALLFLTDLWPVANRYLNSRNYVSKGQFDAPPALTAADEMILKDTSPDYRVLNLSVSPFKDATTSYYHKSIGGYHGAKLKKYHELIDFHLDKEINTFYAGINNVRSDSGLTALTSQLGVLNMLNTKYIILPTREGTSALQNKEANGNAWLVKNLIPVASADSEIAGLYHIDTKHEALIRNAQTDKLGNGELFFTKFSGNGTVSLQSYKPNDLVYTCEMKDKQFAVFSEIYYPEGWNAYLDGKQVSYVNVDYVLRGMQIPDGRHSIEFKFEPAVYKTGNKISLAGSILLLLCTGGSLFIGFRKKDKQ
ncbi:MAG: YfhO family protein [Bacteroidia bacterium]